MEDLVEAYEVCPRRFVPYNSHQHLLHDRDVVRVFNFRLLPLKFYSKVLSYQGTESCRVVTRVPSFHVVL